MLNNQRATSGIERTPLSDRVQVALAPPRRRNTAPLVRHSSFPWAAKEWRHLDLTGPGIGVRIQKGTGPDPLISDCACAMEPPYSVLPQSAQKPVSGLPRGSRRALNAGAQAAGETTATPDTATRLGW